jgi:general secretion pathway protein D
MRSSTGGALSYIRTFSRQYRSLRRVSRRRVSRYGAVRVAILVAGAALLCACNQFVPVPAPASVPATGHDADPDVFDRVRSLDLLPRFPRQEQASGQNAASRARPAVYSGSDVPVLAAPPTQAAPSGDGYELNFENTPVATVVKVVLGDIMGVGYSIDPRVQGTVTLASVKPVPKSDMLFVLENALHYSGIALLKDAHSYRVVPLGDAVGAGTVEQTAERAEPGFGVSVVPLHHVSAATLMKLLDSFATRPGIVRADTTRNLLLIQGSGPERRSAIDTALSFDVDWMRGQNVGIFPVQNSNPEPVIAELEKIMETGDNGLNHDLVKFQPVARMNAILVVTRKAELLRTAGNWISRLDNADTSRTGVHVYHIKFGEARQMARVLNDMFTGNNGSSSFDQAANQIAPGSGFATTTSGERPGFGAGEQQGAGGFTTRPAGAGGNEGRGGFGATQSTLGAQQAAAAAADARGLSSGGQSGPPVLPGVRITADVVNNALLIYANQESYRIIERTLAQLDRPQLQVAIDATVAEVTLNDNLSYGVQFFLGNSTGGSVSNIPASPPGQPSTNAAGLVGAALNRAFPGFNFLVGNELSPKAILDALHAVTDVKVLSNPSLVVIDNQVATLDVGNDVPITTGSASVLNAATATSNTVVNTIDYRSTGIILRVIPRVNVNGNVRLDIEQEISQVVNGSTNGTAAATNTTPTISVRKVKSSIAVAAGQTVLLAGLIQEQREIDRSGIPLLDEIPKVGDLFSHQTKSVARTELIIFIRPQIIRDSVDAHFVAEELRAKLKGTIGPVGSNVGSSARVH